MVVDECVEKGKAVEANQLLKHLLEIGAAEEDLREQLLRVASAAGDGDRAAELARGMLDSTDENQRVGAADNLVLANAPEARAINEAISQLCQGDWEAMQSTLKEVCRQSPFAHWRVFLRGCAAFYRGERAEAERCFSHLPAGSVPARKATAFPVLRGDLQAAPGSAIADACVLAGAPKLAEGLTVAQKYWKAGRYRAAYLALKRYGGPAFPSLKVNVWGQLTRFFQLAEFGLGEDRLDDWLVAVFDIHGTKKPGRDAEGYLVTNIMSRQLANSDTGESLKYIWLAFIQAREKLLGKSPRFLALCHYFRALSEQPPAEFFFDKPGEDDFDATIRLLKLSATADPTFEDAPVTLLRIYRTLKLTPKVNQLLDEMTDRFPESKTVLLEAGRGCLDRKAYQKGLTYLEKARRIDPLDADVQTQIRRGLRAKAEAHFEKPGASQVDKGRKTFEQLLAAIHGNPPPGESRGHALIEWSVLEDLAGGADSLAEQKFAEASESISAHVATFYRSIYREMLTCEPESSKHRIETKHDPAQAVEILQLWRKLELENGGPVIYDWADWVQAYVRKAIRRFARQHRNSALQLVADVAEGGLFWKDLQYEVVKSWLRCDRRDPHFICMRWEIEDGDPSPKELERTINEARERGDRAALAALEQFQTRRAEERDLADDDDDHDDWGGGAAQHDWDDARPQPENAALVEKLKTLTPAERVHVLIQAGLPHADARRLSMMIDVYSGQLQLPSPEPDRSEPKSKPRPKNKPKVDQFEFPF